MSLVLGAGAYCNWIEALPVLAMVGFNEGQARAIELTLTQDTLRQALAQPHSVVLQSTEQLQLLSQELTQYPQQKVILLYSDLPQLLEGLIKTNHDIVEALEQWKTNLLALQDFYRMYRKQTLLFNLSQVLSHPHHFVEVCNQHGVSMLDTAVVDLVVHDAAKAWASTLAQQILLQDPSLAQVVQYTKAMTWPLTSEDSAVSDAGVLGILAVLRQLQSTSALEKELVYTQTKLAAQHEEKQNLLQENQLVLEQLLTVQAELETLILTKETSLALQKELGAENTLLLQQLHTHQEELERIYLKDKDATTNPDRQVPVVLDNKKESSTDLVVVSEVGVYEPEHTVPPKSFFERRAARKARRDALRKDKERAQHIVQSPWFDAQWYLQQYPDVAQDPVQSANPALHYMRLGGFEGRNPSPYFDSSFYLESNPDVAITGINPLWHFLRNGQAEGRQPHP